jgi:hypothetical protein
VEIVSDSGKGTLVVASVPHKPQKDSEDS